MNDLKLKMIIKLTKEKIISNLSGIVDRLCLLLGIHANGCAEIMKNNDAIIIEESLDKLKPVLESINNSIERDPNIDLKIGSCECNQDWRMPPAGGTGGSICRLCCARLRHEADKREGM